MKISIEKKESYSCIKILTDQLDASVASDLKAVLLKVVENGMRNVLADLSCCSTCDTMGLSALLLGNRLCQGTGGRFVLCGLSTGLSEKMDMLGFREFFAIAGSQDEAVQSFM